MIDFMPYVREGMLFSVIFSVLAFFLGYGLTLGARFLKSII
jgi:hypothetical protein